MAQYKMDGNEIAKTRAAFSDLAAAQNERRAAKAENAAVRLTVIDNRTEAEQAAAAHALEVGDWSDHALRQRNMSELAVQRARVEDEHRYWQNQPLRPHDPVEALIQSKASEPETVAWLRSHPADTVALATNSDPRRVAQIQASHNDAIAEGHEPGSKGYFNHVNKFLDGKSLGATRGSDGGKRQVRVVKEGQSAHGDDELTPGEYRAATEDVCWGNNAPPGKRGQPVGVEEYLRRRQAMRNQPGWFDKLD